MNKLTPEQERELEVIIGHWAQEKNILSPGDVIEVELKVISRPFVSISLTKEDGTSSPYDRHSVDEFEFSVRAQRLIGKTGARTIGQLRRCTIRDLYIDGFGKVTLQEIQDKLETLGIKVNWTGRKT